LQQGQGLLGISCQLEVILVMNGISEFNFEQLRNQVTTQFANLKMFRIEEHCANTARLAGFEHSTGEFVCWHDADDLQEPQSFVAHLKKLLSCEKADFSYADLKVCVHVEGVDFQKKTLIRKPILDWEEDKDRLIKFMPPAAVVWKRKAALKLVWHGAWKPGVSFGDDTLCYAVAAALKLSSCRAEGATVVYQLWSNGQLSMRLPESVRLQQLFAVQQYLQGMGMQFSNVSKLFADLLSSNAKDHVVTKNELNGPHSETGQSQIKDMRLMHHRAEESWAEMPSHE
jgi:glycosyltransferase involved in cell wall biosynthesis